jgi:ABC-2 type transport system permease protein
MLTGFWKLSWVEAKVFLREPMGVILSLGLPVLAYVVLGRAVGAGPADAPSREPPPFNVAIFAALVIAIGAALSLITIISLYREGGILKRLRATPLSPVTILTAHVFLKLVFTVLGMGALVLAGRQFFPGAMDVDLVAFTAALLLSTLSVLSLGFVIASVVPTARYAQPVGASLLYPMIAVSGLFFPVAELPAALRATALALPTTHAVSLLQGIWDGSGWAAHWVNVAALVLAFLVCTAVSAKVFRWE